MRSRPARPVQLVGVVTSVKVMVPLSPRQSPVAVALPVLEGSVDSPHCNCLSIGQVRSGAPASITVTACWHVLLLHWLVSVTAKLRVNEPGAVAVTETVWLLVAPLMAPLPEMDQPYAAKPAGPVSLVVV